MLIICASAVINISTRRFCARPSLVELDATGSFSPSRLLSDEMLRCLAIRDSSPHSRLFLGKILVELLAAGVVGISYYGDIGVGELLQIICDSVERGIGGCGKIAFAGLEKYGVSKNKFDGIKVVAVFDHLNLDILYVL